MLQDEGEARLGAFVGQEVSRAVEGRLEGRRPEAEALQALVEHHGHSVDTMDEEPHCSPSS